MRSYVSSLAALARSILPGLRGTASVSLQPQAHNHARVIAALEPSPHIAVETEEAKWSYAASFKLHAPPRLGGRGEPTVVVDLEVEAGAIGIGCTTADYSSYVDREVFAPAGRRRRFYVPMGALGSASHVILRNVSSRGRSLARVYGIEIRRAVGALPIEARAMKVTAVAQVRLAAEILERLAQRLRRRGAGSSFLGRLAIDTLLYPRDVRTVVREYFRTFGRYPRLFRPKTFSEKLQQAKLLGRKRRHTSSADKLAVRDVVKQRVGSNVVVPKIYWIGTDLTDASRQVLPNRFVIKSNHASGQVMIVDNARAFDWSKATIRAQEWLECDYDMGFAEWQYRWIPKRLFIEEHIGATDQPPIDYKFFCFHGRTELIQVDLDRHSNHTRAMFDRDFRRLAVKFCYPNYEGTLERPCSFDRMRAAAELLARGEAFVRVDLYDGDLPIFGELTLSPEAGLGTLDPPEWDHRLWRLWSRGGLR